MSSNLRSVVVVGFACVFVAGLVTATVAVLGSSLEGLEHDLFFALVDRRFGALMMIGFATCGLLLVILQGANELLVRSPARAAEEVVAMLEDPTARLTERGTGELKQLIVAVNRLADQRQRRDADVEARIRQANAAADADRNRFAVLMAELAQGVVVCNMDGRILLYNRRARELLAGSSGQGVAALGLGRSIYGVLDRHLIGYALESIEARGVAHRHFVVSSESGSLLRVLVAPVPKHVSAMPEMDAVLAEQGLSGYLLMVEDMTEAFESESVRDQLLQNLTDNSRGSVANLRAAAETMHEYVDMSADDRERFVAVVREEAAILGGRIESAARKFSAVLKARWPLEEMQGADLLAAVVRRISDRCSLPVILEEVDSDLWVKVDGFSLLQALTYLAIRLYDECEITELRLRLVGDTEMAQVDMIWSGTSAKADTVQHWELDPMFSATESSPLSVRDVVDRCGGEVWVQHDRVSGKAFFRFLLPAVAAAQGRGGSAATVVDSRPEFYDFDLFKREEVGGDLDDRLLAQLTYTVFDTETTGLDPSAGDEIIQIGAVRIVNRRLLRQESFEQLINPQRSLPASSVKIHGISAEMLVNQPPIARVLPVFRAFVADTVLVAHNAAFDMRFLELKVESTGVRFDRPVLDTFLLSAVLFPNQESHRLEAIADRLGVSVLGRHTAVGDAIVTAEVFLKMLPLLAAKGIRTLGEARTASEKTYHARISY